MNFLSYAENVEPSRAQALDFVRAQGLPTRKNEDWKYTSLKSLGEKNYTPALANLRLSEAEAKKIQGLFGADFTNVVFINGVWDQNLSQKLPAEISLSEAPATKTFFKDSLEALNFLYALKMYKVVVRKESSVDKAVNFIFWSQGELTMSSVQIQISVESRAQAQFIQSHAGSQNDYFANSVIEMNVAANAKASLIKVQEESLLATHIGRTRVIVNASAEVETLAFSNGAQLARHSLEVLMQGAGASAQVHGVYAVTDSQHVDNDTTIDHQVGHCNTSQLYKGILDGESRAVFNGKVLIRKDAQKANSEQLNNNLLLSRKAEADSKPMLEIEADDVKASHGSTVGQMDKEELFYLLSRAIPKTKAISMMSYGFLSEVIDRLGNEKTQNWLKEKLDGAFERLSTGSL